MKVLLAASNWTETLGHVVRSAAIAQQLASRGHEVAFLGFPSYREYLPPQVSFYACEPLPPPYEPNVYFGHHTYEDVVYASGQFDEGHIVRTIERERDVIRAFRPDIIFNDEQFAISISAAVEGVPVVSLVTMPLHPSFNRHLEAELPQRNALLRRLRNGWNRCLRKYGMAPIGHLCELLYRAQVLVAPTVPSLEPELTQYAPEVHYVGPLEPAGPFDAPPSWRWDDDAASLPLVYIYLSSLSVGVNTKTTFEKLYAVLKELDCRAVFALGKFNDVDPGFAPVSEDGRIRLERFVPGRAVMREASLAVFPATHSMLMSAVRFQVPSLLLPDLFERRFNAERLMRIGLGRIVEDIEAASIETLSSLANELLALRCSPNGLQDAAHVQAELLQYHGAERVVRLMESYCGEGAAMS